MLAAMLLAAAATASLGVWPQEMGEPFTTVGEVELYVLEPEDDHWIVAIKPLSQPLKLTDRSGLEGLARLAERLGADAVLLLAELPEESIPREPGDPLPGGERYVMAVFLTFDFAGDWDPAPATKTALSGGDGRSTGTGALEPPNANLL